MMTIKGLKEYCGETLAKLVVPVKNQLCCEWAEDNDFELRLIYKRDGGA